MVAFQTRKLLCVQGNTILVSVIQIYQSALSTLSFISQLLETPAPLRLSTQLNVQPLTRLYGLGSEGGREPCRVVSYCVVL